MCGESPLRPPDLTLRGIGAKVLHAVTTIDGRLLRTIWILLRHPGELTVAHLNGKRMPYVPPFQLFLRANAFFFAMQSLTDTQVFGSTLQSHLYLQDRSPLARSLVAERVAKLRTDLPQYTSIFDRAAVLNAKSLIILMVIPFTLLLWTTFLRARKPFVTLSFSRSISMRSCCCCSRSRSASRPSRSVSAASDSVHPSSTTFFRSSI